MVIFQVASVSKAISHLWHWLQAVYAYGKVQDELNMFRATTKEKEQQLAEVQAQDKSLEEKFVSCVM